MVSTYTPNKNLEKPGNGDYVDTWNVPANGDFDIIDQAFGGVTSLNATSGDATLTDTQYASLILYITGAVSANTTYTIPSGVGGQWIVRNTTTDASGGPWTVAFVSGGGGVNVTIDRNVNVTIFSDGTNIRLVGSSASVPGSTTQVIYNNAGSLAGSSNLTFNGTNLSVGGSITAGTSVAATTSVSDAIGNVRNVPINNQGYSYTLIASDNGKCINTADDVTVPSGVFAVGNTVSIYNNSGSTINITQGAGATLFKAGVGTTGSRTLSNYGLATIICISSNDFVITGTGVV